MFFKNIYFFIITAHFDVGQVHVYETGINFETTFTCLGFRLLVDDFMNMRLLTI